MPAINGVRNSAVVKNKKGKTSVLAVVFGVIIAILLTAAAFLIFWNFYYQEEFTNQVIVQMEAGEQKAYRAVRDIVSGEYLDGAVEEVVVPSSLISSDLLTVGADISGLKASGNISANSLITEVNSYNPIYETPVIDSTRQYVIDYIETPGISAGDYMDIRLKVFTEDGGVSSYKDYIVISKVEVIDKNESGELTLNLTESEILNLNSAVIQAASQDTEGQIYTGKYVSPATQAKHIVTYDGAGAEYTEEELREAQEILRQQMGEDGQTASDVQETEDTSAEGTGTEGTGTEGTVEDVTGIVDDTAENSTEGTDGAEQTGSETDQTDNVQ